MRLAPTLLGSVLAVAAACDGSNSDSTGAEGTEGPRSADGGTTSEGGSEFPGDPVIPDAPYPFAGKLLAKLPEEIAGFPMDLSTAKFIDLPETFIPSDKCSAKKFLLPPNTVYYVHGQFVFDDCVDLEIRGSGAGKTAIVLARDAKFDSLVLFNGGRNVTLTDVLLWGNGDNRPMPDVVGTGKLPGSAIESWNIENFVAERVRVEASMGVGFVTLSLNRGHINDSWIFRNARYLTKPDAKEKAGSAYPWVSEGLALNNANGLTVANNEIAFNIGTGLGFYAQPGKVCESVTVTNNNIHDNGRIDVASAGIGLDAGEGLIRNSRFESNQIHDNVLSGILTNMRVENCTFDNNVLNDNKGSAGTGWGIQLREGTTGNTGRGNRGSGNTPGGNANPGCTSNNNDVQFAP